MRSPRRRASFAVSTLLLAASLTTGLALPAAADSSITSDSGSLAVSATVGGSSLRAAGANSPIVLRPTDSTVVQVSVTNKGSSSVDIRAVRLNARVLGLAFFSYTTRVDLTVAPGATGKRTFALDLTDLDGQATGLLPAELSLLAPDRTELYSESGTVDVKGKLGSVYGVFGLAVAAITLLLLAALLFRLVRRTLPESRWARATRFALPGLGLGLVVTFTLGAVRVLVPTTSIAIGLILGGLAVGLVLGYLTPNPGDEADRNTLDERDVVTGPRTTAPLHHTPADAATFAPPPLTPAARPAPAPPAVPLQENQAEIDDPRQTRAVGQPPPPPPSP